MTHGVDFIEALYGANLGVEQALEHEVHALFVVGHVVHYLLFLSVGQCHLDECLVESDSLNAASGEH